MAAASRRLARRTMVGLVVALVLALLTSGAGLYAYQQQRVAAVQASRAQRAQAAAEMATKEAQLTESRYLTGLADQAVKDGDAATGMLLALEALPDANGDDELRRARPLWGPAGEVVGGLLGRTSLGLLFIDLMFLPAPLRGSGLGSRILRMAEDEGRARGCINAVLFTISFQDPDFYARFGWRELGRVDCKPHGTSRVVMTKTLVGVTDQSA